jgi:microcystin-dependent protein
VAAYRGEIRIFCGDFAPAGWAFCDGQLLEIQEHRALFALLGTSFGGDGKTHFALPDLRGRVVMHQGTSDASGNRHAFGAKGGVEEVALNDEQMPRHTHRVLARQGPGNTANPSRALHAAVARDTADGPARAPERYSRAAPSGRLHRHAVRPSGGSQPHDNMMPFLTLGFIVALDGKDPGSD